METALELVLAGIPVAVLVALGVQGLKVFGFVDGTTAPRAAIILALLFGVGVIVGSVLPEVEEYITLGFSTFAGAMTAGLGYAYIARPLLENFGIDVSASDLN